MSNFVKVSVGACAQGKICLHKQGSSLSTGTCRHFCIILNIRKDLVPIHVAYALVCMPSLQELRCPEIFCFAFELLLLQQKKLDYVSKYPGL